MTPDEYAIRDDQVLLDASAICPLCADRKRYEPALWCEADGGYYHRDKKAGGDVYCDAALIWMLWSEQVQGAVVG